MKAGKFTKGGIIFPFAIFKYKSPGDAVRSIVNLKSGISLVFNSKVIHI